MNNCKFRQLLTAFGVGAIWAATVTFLLMSLAMAEPEGIDWLSWNHNTDPDGASFIGYYRGEYPQIASIKANLDIDIKSGQFLCVKLEQELLDPEATAPYTWWVQIWWDSTTAMAMDFQTGAVCMKVYTLHEVPTKVFKMHIFGEGYGGVRVTPIITVEDERIYRPNLLW